MTVARWEGVGGGAGGVGRRREYSQRQGTG